MSNTFKLWLLSYPFIVGAYLYFEKSLEYKCVVAGDFAGNPLQHICIKALCLIFVLQSHFYLIKGYRLYNSLLTVKKKPIVLLSTYISYLGVYFDMGGVGFEPTTLMLRGCSIHSKSITNFPLISIAYCNQKWKFCNRFFISYLLVFLNSDFFTIFF